MICALIRLKYDSLYALLNLCPDGCAILHRLQEIM